MSRSKSAPSTQFHPSYYQSYQERATIPSTPLLNVYLLRLMAAKRSNLCLSADVHSTSQLLQVAEECGDSLCLLKTHADMIFDFGDRTIKGLLEIAARKRFLIFEDRKFGDIGSTVQAQYAAGSHRIAGWASIVNAHIFPGPAVITALKSAAISAVSHYNSTMSTEITGGNSDYFPDAASSPRIQEPGQDDSDDEEESGSDDEEDEEEEDDGDEPTSTEHLQKQSSRHDSTQSNSSLALPRRPSDLATRKASVVSISTTISSSTEFISPPPTISPTGGHPQHSDDSFSSANAPDLATIGSVPLSRGLLLLAQMSSADNLLDATYTAKAVEMAREEKEFVLGFIAQEMLNKQPSDNFLVMTPGVSLPSEAELANLSLSEKSPVSPRTTAPSSRPAAKNAAKNTGADGLGQQYNTPRHVIVDKGVDVIIVGRGILGKDDRASEAERYRKEGWAAYLERTTRTDDGGNGPGRRSKGR